MDVTSLVGLCKEVVSDWRVIVSAVVFITSTSLANYVVRYRKKGPRLKIKPRSKPAAESSPAPAQEGSPENEQGPAEA